MSDHVPGILFLLFFSFIALLVQVFFFNLALLFNTFLGYKTSACEFEILRAESNPNMSFPIQVPICLPVTHSHLMVLRWAEVRKVRNPARALPSAASRPPRPKPWTSCTNTPTNIRANRPRSARRCHTSETEECQRGKEKGIEKWIDRVRLPHSESCSLTTTWATHLYLASTTCLMPQVSTPPACSSSSIPL